MRTAFILTTCLAIALGLFARARARVQNVSSAPDTAKTGAALYMELRCGACHEIAASGINIPPSLANVGDKFKTSWIEVYLKSPYRRRWASTGARPILRMPNFLLSDEEARVLAAFLATRRDTTRIKKLYFEVDSTKVKEGEQIYQEYACYGCHKVAGIGGDMGPDLNEVGKRLRPKYLAAFLQNPQAFIPDSPMKISELWDEEVRALVSYLMSLK